jgi:hypothetical protein
MIITLNGMSCMHLTKGDYSSDELSETKKVSNPKIFVRLILINNINIVRLKIFNRQIQTINVNFHHGEYFDEKNTCWRGLTRKVTMQQFFCNK